MARAPQYHRPWLLHRISGREFLCMDNIKKAIGIMCKHGSYQVTIVPKYSLRVFFACGFIQYIENQGQGRLINYQDPNAGLFLPEIFHIAGRKLKTERWFVIQLKNRKQEIKIKVYFLIMGACQICLGELNGTHQEGHRTREKDRSGRRE